MTLSSPPSQDSLAEIELTGDDFAIGEDRGQHDGRRRKRKQKPQEATRSAENISLIERSSAAIVMTSRFACLFQSFLFWKQSFLI